MFNGYYNNLKTTGEPETSTDWQNPLQLLNEQENIGKTLSSNGNLQIDYALYWVENPGADDPCGQG